MLGMKTSSSQFAKSTSALVLPKPVSVKKLADDMAGIVSQEILVILDELEKLGGPIPPEQVAAICDRVISTCSISSEPIPSTVKNSGLIYDLYFSVNRLPDSASKNDIVKALTIALAVVMRNTADVERRSSSLTPVEFGLLKQSFAAAIAILRDLSIEPKNHPRA